MLPQCDRAMWDSARSAHLQAISKPPCGPRSRRTCRNLHLLPAPSYMAALLVTASSQVPVKTTSKGGERGECGAMGRARERRGELQSCSDGKTARERGALAGNRTNQLLNLPLREAATWALADEFLACDLSVSSGSEDPFSFSYSYRPTASETRFRKIELSQQQASLNEATLPPVLPSPTSTRHGDFLDGAGLSIRIGGTGTASGCVAEPLKDWAASNAMRTRDLQLPDSIVSKNLLVPPPTRTW